MPVLRQANLFSTTSLLLLLPRPPLRQRALVRTVSGGSPRGNRSQLRVWPFIAIFTLGSLSYIQLVKRRIGDNPNAGTSSIGAISTPPNNRPSKKE